ncbi:MAG: response regulator [Eubacterium sp.]|nr:response regulator [Eubacterium sp.]
MSKNTILIVDDEVINRTILKESFEGAFSILEAGNGHEAIEILKSKSGDIGAVLLDLLMPGSDGFEVLKFMEYCGLDKEIPVIVITSDDSEGIKKRLSEYRISDVLNKPFLPMVISRRTKNLIRIYEDKRKDLEKLSSEIEQLKKENAELKEKIKGYEKTLKKIEKNFI